MIVTTMMIRIAGIGSLLKDASNQSHFVQRTGLKYDDDKILVAILDGLPCGLFRPTSKAHDVRLSLIIECCLTTIIVPEAAQFCSTIG
jgi:hypothetical protein